MTYGLKTELESICEAFKLGAYISSKTINTGLNGFIETEFTTEKGVYRHYFKYQGIKEILTTEN